MKKSGKFPSDAKSGFPAGIYDLGEGRIAAMDDAGMGFVGALINGHMNGRYLDDKFFWPVFECAETLGVPIYLHPQYPPQPVVDAYYSGFAPEVSTFHHRLAIWQHESNSAIL